MHTQTDTDATRVLSSRLGRFMTRPQRHRLLHGFPLAAAMPFADAETRRRHHLGDPELAVVPDIQKELLVGVLPHPFCNPKLNGCGFCTFPHERFHRERANQAVDGVIREITDKVERQPQLTGKKVSGLYIGGGTANLTPADAFGRLAKSLDQAFDLRDAEISLEGVPAYFLRPRRSLIDVMRQELSGHHFRISMGIQTFSDRWLERMGRKAFGDADTIADVVKLAHRNDMTVSGDLLINLPGQSLDEMRTDVARANELGLDQICVYHLVMFRGLGTPWSRDPALLAQLPTNEKSSANWMAIRDQLTGLGFRQTTLTNFERVDPRANSHHYLYESLSFQPEKCQMLGFGPSGISMVSKNGQDLKTMNPESAAEYLRSLASEGPTWNRYYRFDLEDRKLFYLTRHFAKLEIDACRYREIFLRDLEDDFGDELSVLSEAGLVKRTPSLVKLTPAGMFYADSVAGVLADRHFRARRDLHLQANDNSQSFM